MCSRRKTTLLLTNLKQAGATLVIKKAAGAINRNDLSTARDAEHETWNGRMYSNDEAARISGVKSIVNAADRDSFLNSLKEKKDEAVRSSISFWRRTRPIRMANENFASRLNCQEPGTVLKMQMLADFAELRQVKSPYN